MGRANLRAFLVVVIAVALLSCTPASSPTETRSGAKLYWFIPDGMRAEPTLFDIYSWAEEGKLPNIKRMMEQGSYGYSIPVFPGHTPVNFATLLTGTTPLHHGVADGPMHVEGRPLDKVAIGGFSSVAKKVAPIWVTLEQANRSVFLLSIPGSTPPELSKGNTVRGRWGGWGADFHATNFDQQNPQQFAQGRTARLFTFGPPLQKYIMQAEPSGWSAPPVSYSPAREVVLNHYGATLYSYIYDATDDGNTNYDRIAFSWDKRTVIADLRKSEWSGWLPIMLQWTSGNDSLSVETQFRIRVILLEPDGFFRIRLFYNNLNGYVAQPPETAAELVDSVGPMVDFVDNYPAQLIYYPEDKDAFLEEMNMSFGWHQRAARHILKAYKPDILIQDIYSPNQMLTSRWWMGYVDPQSRRYGDVTAEERERLWTEVKGMYLQLDSILGEMLDAADENTYVVLSSDHGAVPLDRMVHLNNLFARKGWLKFQLDPITGEPLIDWQNSTVIYLKMDNVYINPEGLSGPYKRASGPKYEALRHEVIDTLRDLQDSETGVRPLATVVRWEDSAFLDLPQDRVGDLIIANGAGYGWNEEPTQSGDVFSVPLISGYKQAIQPDHEEAMWTPFVIVGPGVKAAFRLPEPVLLADQYPTLLYLMGIDAPHKTDGHVLTEILVS
ncbi:alkaline phosphatase family protein [Candidatus Woesearchaeota archaeon]|nr:alkaline phosphatase family protein [Candidatus Woesearchaeota archaeon]